MARGKAKRTALEEAASAKGQKRLCFSIFQRAESSTSLSEALKADEEQETVQPPPPEQKVAAKIEVTTTEEEHEKVPPPAPEKKVAAKVEAVKSEEEEEEERKAVPPPAPSTPSAPTRPQEEAAAKTENKFAPKTEAAKAAEEHETAPPPAPSTPSVTTRPQKEVAAKTEKKAAPKAEAKMHPAAAALILRINSLDQSRFRCKALWGFAVLDINEHTVSAVQRAHRNHMRLLHPDKILVNTPAVSDAIEHLRQARQCCEQSLSLKSPPLPPAKLRGTVVSSAAGKRRIRVEWQAASKSSSAASLQDAPLRRYIVAALNPEFGRALPVATLESDYNQEQQRFIRVEDLCSYVLAEEDLPKMQWLFNRPSATVQVAAANEIGQSSWAILQMQMPQANSGRQRERSR
mmetsp:Transcript_35349/g.82613  ORF Transcript_35349/g.82613 Transcript_35349/m.82613 type:complete len:404 (+) Transcript_35349:46-1257(+)